MSPTWTEGRRRQLEAFLAAYPAYASTHALDELRAAEFSRLDAEGHVYLDYTGGGLYAESQVRRHSELLLSRRLRQPALREPDLVPRGTNSSSAAAYHVLDFFNASPDEYTVVFTANASQALKLVGESYPFQPGGPSS